ncbi:hypothetical protein F5Y16DRAFT_393147 [Xylariaceae sp. FL0255]|nr:hypothetical protein F5Y16DRAFT_393147 [Xylariaceae sp. FL0255]
MGHPPKHEKRAQAKAQGVGDVTMFKFASLAYVLGFWSPEVLAVLERSPDKEVARKACLAARPPAARDPHIDPECRVRITCSWTSR